MRDGKSVQGLLMEFRIYKRRVEKLRDAWVEVLIIDPITTPISYVIYKVNRSSILPYIATAICFLTRTLAAYAFYIANVIAGALLFFLSMLIDGLDGKLSRSIFIEDPKLRGLLDFLLDQIGTGLVLLSLYFYFSSDGRSVQALLIFVITTLLYIQQACTSSLFRLRWEMGVKDPINKVFSYNAFIKHYMNIQARLDRFRLMAHPTSVDAEFIAFVVAPFVGFHEFTLWIAILFILVDLMVIGLFPALLLATFENKNKNG